MLAGGRVLTTAEREDLSRLRKEIRVLREGTGHPVATLLPCIRKTG
jgi:hypothetical protein